MDHVSKILFQEKSLRNCEPDVSGEHDFRAALGTGDGRRSGRIGANFSAPLPIAGRLRGRRSGPGASSVHGCLSKRHGAFVPARR